MSRLPGHLGADFLGDPAQLAGVILTSANFTDAVAANSNEGWEPPANTISQGSTG